MLRTNRELRNINYSDKNKNVALGDKRYICNYIITSDSYCYVHHRRLFYANLKIQMKLNIRSMFKNIYQQTEFTNSRCVRDWMFIVDIFQLCLDIYIWADWITMLEYL
ncbi:unnamed protein product [Brugia timori]|uniref:Uncharacterized protein n=1 Tax=Brugia timori TaxID=42155 RepID=A0A0R3QXK5_9BILA|nr:unnamed protein product [Brugia timori]